MIPLHPAIETRKPPLGVPGGVQGGGIRFKGREIRVSSASVRQPIALRPSLETDGMSRLYFATIISDSLVLKELDVL